MAVFLGAIAMYYLSRLLAAALGWGATEGLFLAGMLMVSSSSIIGKILHETGLNHERSGQLAISVSVLEDVVAVVMLAVLGSVVQLGGADASRASEVGQSLLHLGAFVALIGVAGLIIVPWLLKRMSISMDEELQTLGIAALLFLLAILAQKAGYSLALGAFLLGIIVAETPHRHQVERTFEGMRDVFSAVYFVAIGMQIDVHDLLQSAWLIAGVAVFTLVARPVAVTAGLSIIGVPVRDGMRAGLMTAPVGEFSFVIAQLGVGAAVVPARFYPLIVGVSMVTTLVTPFLARRSERIVTAAFRRQPRWLVDWLHYYQDWLERFMRQRKRSALWQLSRKRLAQIGIEMLFVSGVLVFSRELYDGVQEWLGRDWMFPNGAQVGFWMVLLLAVLAPLVAIWRNCSALALLFAQVSTAHHPRGRQVAPVIEAGLKVVVVAVLTVWLIAVVPAEDTARWLLLASALVAVATVLLLRRKLIYWHCLLEVELKNTIETSETKMTSTAAPWLGRHPDWDLHMIDCTLPGQDDRRAGPAGALRLLRGRHRAPGVHDPAAAARVRVLPARQGAPHGDDGPGAEGTGLPRRSLRRARDGLALRGGAHGRDQGSRLEPGARRDAPQAVAGEEPRRADRGDPPRPGTHPEPGRARGAAGGRRAARARHVRADPQLPRMALRKPGIGRGSAPGPSSPLGCRTRPVSGALPWPGPPDPPPSTPS
jgi:CPA2 family monovalent cation:H+ antiporter-2